MIVLGIHCNFFIFLPIQLKICRCSEFSLSQGQMGTPEKSGAPQRFARPSVFDANGNCPALLKQLFALGKNIILAFWSKTILITRELKLFFLVLNSLSYLFEFNYKKQMWSKIFVGRLNLQRISKTRNYLYRDSKCHRSKSCRLAFFQIVEECCQTSVMFFFIVF